MTAERTGTADIRAVAIGASAGGVQALGELLPALPAGFAGGGVRRAASAARPAEPAGGVFSRKCALAVREAEDKEPVMPGTVYFAPPNYHLLVEAGPQLALSADDLVNLSRPSIDVLFESAAEVYRRASARHHSQRRERGWRRGTRGRA